MLTVRDLMLLGEVAQSSPDGKHWEPGLPMMGYRRWRDRWSDAWSVWVGRAYAVRQTTKADLAKPEAPR